MNYVQMTNSPAFPDGLGKKGMTLRDYMAAKAMPQCFAICATTDTAAKEAYRMADAMIKQREVKDVQE